jgi:hypothetical protein
VARRQGVGHVLEYNPVLKIMTQVFWLFPVGLGLAAILSPPSAEERWLPAQIGAGFFALLIPLTLEIFQRRIELTDQAISQLSPWSKPVRIAWKDVREVSWKIISNEVVIQPKGGRTIRVNAWLSGMETFAQAMEKRLASVPSMPGVVASLRKHMEI